MRKVISFVHLSLDGFAAGPNDELDWISYDPELQSYAHAMHDEMDAVIWGRRTYEGMASYWLTVPADPESSPAELEHARWLGTVTKIVASRTLERVAWGDDTKTLLINDDLPTAISALKQQPGKDMWLMGSTTLLGTFMQLDLIDEYRFTIQPVVMGQGKPLFTQVTRRFPLRLLSAQTFASGVAALHYERQR
jgi:dihydrofolate reductase